MLGLKHNTNVIISYDPDWPIQFAAERQRIADALGGSARGIEHFGSTSVEGLPAKPILDIVVGVSPFEAWEACRAPLIRLGYDYAKNAGVPDDHIFGRGRDASERTHLVHVVEHLGRFWRSNLALRDALRADADLRRDYLAVKEAAASLSPTDRAGYTALKKAFINRAKASLRVS